MSNSLKNTTLVTKYAIKAFMNSLQLAKKVDRQLDEKNVFATKVGATAYIRRPVSFSSTSGAEIVTGDVSDIEEATVAVTLDTWRKVVFHLSSQELTLNIEDAYPRYIKPAMEELAQYVESALAGQYIYIPNFVGTPGTTPANYLAVANARAKLSALGVPMDDTLCAFFDPTATVNIADSLKGVFVTEMAKSALERAKISDYGGFSIFENQSLKAQTVGINTGTPLVNGASQNVTYATAKDTWTQTLITDGWTNSQTGILKAGDVFTIADVYALNRRTRVSTGSLAQFTVTADADSGAATGPATFTITPPIITTGPFATVDAAPANNAAITVATGTGGTAYRQNIAFHKNAMTLAMARLDLPSDGVSAAREDYKGISIRTIRQYSATLDKTIFRFDILYGIKMQNPEYGVRITG